MTKTASAAVKLMSDEGAGRYWGEWPVGISSSQLAMRMKVNRVNASGTTGRPASPMADATCSSTASRIVSTASWSLPGTPEVAFARR